MSVHIRSLGFEKKTGSLRGRSEDLGIKYKLGIELDINRTGNRTGKAHPEYATKKTVSESSEI